jgi:fused signal recognition particle receptor
MPNQPANSLDMKQNFFTTLAESLGVSTGVVYLILLAAALVFGFSLIYVWRKKAHQPKPQPIIPAKKPQAAPIVTPKVEVVAKPEKVETPKVSNLKPVPQEAPKVAPIPEPKREPEPPVVEELLKAPAHFTPEPVPVEEAPELPPEPAVVAVAPASYGQALTKTKHGFMAKLARFFTSSATKLSEEELEEIEAVLYGADLGVRTVEKLLAALKKELAQGAQGPKEILKNEMKNILKAYPYQGLNQSAAKPQVFLFVGVNGAGKTTSIGKLGRRLHDQGKKVIFGAGDTFRAAAVEQLGIWAERVQATVVSGKEGSDSASVLFETINRAKTEGFDAALCDTAGRLHTKVELMDELKKVHRVAEKALGRAPDEVFLVIDATMGQNALAQAREFTQSAPVSGVVLTKIDGTAKGGMALAIAEELKVPICFLGVGESQTDLVDFDADRFVDDLFSEA